MKIGEWLFGPRFVSLYKVTEQIIADNADELWFRRMDFQYDGNYYKILNVIGHYVAANIYLYAKRPTSNKYIIINKNQSYEQANKQIKMIKNMVLIMQEFNIVTAWGIQFERVVVKRRQVKNAVINTVDMLARYYG